VEVLMLLDQRERLDDHKTRQKERAEDFMLMFRGMVASGTDDPFKALKAMLAQEDEQVAEVFDEDALPAPDPQGMAEDEQWLAQRISQVGTMTAAELNDDGGWV
jgi:hypothetical protein